MRKATARLIYELLLDGPQTVSAMSTTCNLTSAALRRPLLLQLQLLGHVEGDGPDGHGRATTWRLTERGRRTLPRILDAHGGLRADHVPDEAL